MAKKVMKIPATVSQFTASPIDSRKKRKVAGYARVSTDHDEQLTSYEAQHGQISEGNLAVQRQVQRKETLQHSPPDGGRDQSRLCPGGK